MNITRQCKLYQLGVEIPEGQNAPFLFVEKILENTFIQIEPKTGKTFYLDKKYPDIVWMSVTKKHKKLFCKWNNFWSTLIKNFSLKPDEVKLLIKVVVEKKLGIKNTKPYTEEPPHGIWALARQMIEDNIVSPNPKHIYGKHEHNQTIQTT